MAKSEKPAGGPVRAALKGGLARAQAAVSKKASPSVTKAAPAKKAAPVKKAAVKKA